MSEPNHAARIERLSSDDASEAQAFLHQAEQMVRPSVQEILQKAIEKIEDPAPSRIEKIDQRTGSQQLASDVETFAFFDVREEIVEPPINLRLWAAQLARSTRLNRGIRTMARNTVGIGFDVVPVEPFDDNTPEKEKGEFKEVARRVKEFFKNINPDQPFTSLMECVVIDKEATGNGYLEFTRTAAGGLDSAFHIPSVTMRILRQDRGYVQIRGGRKRYFKRFGDARIMDARTGKFQGESGFNRPAGGDLGTDYPGTATMPEASRQPGEAERPEESVLEAQHRATEVMHFLLYHPMSDVYGLPRFISAGAAISGNWLSAKRNVVFFKNDAVPRMAVLVTGGKLDQRSREDLAAYLQEGQGEEQAGRVLILQAEEEGTGVDGKSTTKLDLKPMTVGVTEDGSFLNYRVANDEEIREALGLSEVYFRSVKLTKASAVVAKATTDEQEFEPARKNMEHVMNQRLVWGETGLGISGVQLQFQRPETSDPLERARVSKLYSDAAAMTPNEIRRELGLDPFPPEQEWANWPLPVLLLALQGQADPSLIGRPDEESEETDPDGPSNDESDDDEESGDDGEDDGEDEGAGNGDQSLAVRSKDPLDSARRVREALRTLPAGRMLGNLEPELR